MPTFTIIWFGVAGIITSLASLWVKDLTFQFMIFGSATVVAFLFLYPRLRKVTRGKSRKANIEEIVGKTGVVVEEIIPLEGKGMVKVGGDIWRAQADERILKGSVVKVLSVNGNFLIVERG